MTDEHSQHIESATQEMEDLKKYWKDLAWWERDAALNNVFDLIFEIQNIHEFKVRCQMIQAKAEEYAYMNEQDYPSEEELANDPEMDFYYAGNPRLCQGICVDLMQSFSRDDITSLASYMGVDAEEPLDVLMKLNNRSTSIYFALRNKVGSMISEQIHAAQVAGK
jgi:hypothetical protein